MVSLSVPSDDDAAGSMTYAEADRVVSCMVDDAQRRARERYPWSELVQAAYVVGALRARLIVAVRRGYGDGENVDGVAP